MAALTPFQTVGPYLHLGLRAGVGALTAPAAATAVAIHGRLVDGAGVGIGDGVLEFWAAGCASVGRAYTGVDGHYRLDAVLPRTRVDPDGSVHAPHFAVRVLARGILTEYLTRVYFSGQPDNDRDLVLQAVPVQRRGTLVASREGPSAYRFDVIVQGAGETVFFDA